MPSLAVLGLRCWIRTKVSVFQCGLLGVSLAQLGGDSAKGRPSRTETFQGLLPESCRGRRSNYTDPSSHHCHTHAHALVSTKRREALGSAIIGFIQNHLGSSSHTDTHIPKYPDIATLNYTHTHTPSYSKTLSPLFLTVSRSHLGSTPRSAV